MNRKIALILGVILLFCGAYFWVLPAVINANMARIIDFARAKTGFNISVVNPRMTRNLAFSADEFAILNSDNTKALYVEKPLVKALPAIGKIHVNRFDAQDFSVNFVLGETLKLGEYEIPKLPDMRLKNVHVRSYNVSVDTAGKNLQMHGENLDIKGISDRLVLQGLKITGAGIDANLDGEINKFNAKFPDLDLNLTLNSADTSKLITFLPDKDLSPDINIPELKKTGFNGRAAGALKISGSAKQPDVIGEIVITNAGIPATTVKDAVIKLIFEGGKIVMDVAVPVGKEKVFVKGPLELYGGKNVDFTITSTQNVDLKQAQTVLNPLHKILRFDMGPLPVIDLKGFGNVILHVTGNRETPLVNGKFNFKNTSVSFLDTEGLTVKNGAGSLIFEGTDIKSDIKSADLNGKPLIIEGKFTVAGDLDLKIRSDGQDLAELVKAVPSPITTASGLVNFNAHVTGKVVDFNDIVPNKNIFAKGTLEFLGNTIDAAKVSGKVNFDKDAADFDLETDIGGLKISGAGVLKDKNLNAKGKLHLAQSYIPLEIRNNTLTLNKINAMFDSMPFMIDGKITNIAVEPKFNLYLNTRVTQEFLDQFVNAKALYPIKVKGDVDLTSRLTGELGSLNVKSELELDEDAQIYYMGATIGDPMAPVKINVDSTMLPESLKINSLRYDKIVSSQNNRPYPTPQLSMSGTLNFLDNNNVGFQNFKVKTQTPTDAKIFNIIFRKPIMKQGLFNSDLVINGTAADPKILGTFDITSIEMPFFDALITDINMRFKPGIVNITSKGVVVSNPMTLEIAAKNSFLPPYVINDLKLDMADLDINKITNMMRDYEVETIRGKGKSEGEYIDITQLVIRNAVILADKVTVRNINADNFSAHLSLDNKSALNVKTFKFDIANGLVNGDLNYNLLSHNSKLNINLRDANASMMTEALFDLKGQIYGSMTGVANLACSGKTYETCLQTLSGAGSFKVANGKMPKLGSLEYLLKAGNLVQGGFGALSFNSLMDLLVPLKTGEFESIDGDIAIHGGVADTINIYSRGKDLNMYMSGSYNLVGSVADMDIFGSLSKDVTSVAGKLRNASLNSLFNTIPSAEDLPANSGLSKIPSAGNVYRRFMVEVFGDINGDNYIQSFKWVK